MARVLGNAGFADEARSALLDAIHGMGSALAVERRLPEPAELKDALQPPLSHRWGVVFLRLKNAVAFASICHWQRRSGARFHSSRSTDRLPLPAANARPKRDLENVKEIAPF